MKTLAQDADNDIYLEGHDLKVVSGVDAYAVIISDAVRTVLGELQLDIGRGVDYFNTVFSNVNGVPNWRAEVEDIIRSYDFVQSVGEMNVSIDNSTHTLSYEITISTDRGQIVVSGSR